MHARSPTLQTIADAAGVSCSAVSRALRNHPSIPAKTRERICEAAERSGYRCNPLVSALMSARRRSSEPASQLPLAWVTSFKAPQPWLHAHIAPELHMGLCERAEQRGYRLEELWLHAPGLTPRRASEILYQRGIAGVIVGPLPVPHGHLRLDWKNFCSVAIGYSVARPAMHRVISHHVHAVQIAMRRLRHAGFRRIGFAMEMAEDKRVDGQFAASYLREQQTLARGERLSPFLAGSGEWSRTPFLRWFARSRPEVILSVHPEAIVPWLESSRIAVPQDVGVVDLYHRHEHGSRFAGVSHNAQAIGAGTIDLLVDLIQMNDRGIPAAQRTVLVEPTWREGASLPKIAPARALLRPALA